MAQRQALPGYAQDRLIMLSTLLYLIDPVRDKATAYGLDMDSNDGPWQSGYLERKFLDSFALISSTSRKGGETAAAVCLEQGHSSGTILRLARNLGVSRDDLNGLHGVLGDLSIVARAGYATSELENRILHRIIVLDDAKIKDLLDRLRRNTVQQDIKRAVTALMQDNIFPDDKGRDFKLWFAKLPELVSLPADGSPLALMPRIKWASKARWVYQEQIETLFSRYQGHISPWIQTIFKIGRYYAASRAMIDYALKQPDVFKSIRVEAIEEPPQKPSNITNRTALADLLKSLGKQNDEQLMAKLRREWGKDDPEAHFYAACQHLLTVHAEMQLVSFYDQHPELSHSRHMGTSKKACYLCNKFLILHPLQMKVSACHQKIYPSWSPALCPPSLVEKYKAHLQKLIRNLEAVAKRELDTELGHRRAINLDSTAGPSLTFPTNRVPPSSGGAW